MHACMHAHLVGPKHDALRAVAVRINLGLDAVQRGVDVAGGAARVQLPRQRQQRVAHLRRRALQRGRRRARCTQAQRSVEWCRSMSVMGAPVPNPALLRCCYATGGWGPSMHACQQCKVPDIQLCHRSVPISAAFSAGPGHLEHRSLPRSAKLSQPAAGSRKLLAQARSPRALFKTSRNCGQRRARCLRVAGTLSGWLALKASSPC